MATERRSDEGFDEERTETEEEALNEEEFEENFDDAVSELSDSVREVGEEEEKEERRGRNRRSDEDADVISASTSAAPSFSEQFPFHKACFENDGETVREFLVTAERLKTTSTSRVGKEEKYDFDLLNSFDSRGNTALHVAVMRKNTDIVRMLTEHPLVDVNLKNCVHGWKPLDEALHVKDRQAAIYIVTAKKRKAKESLETNSPALMQRLLDAPDFSAKLKWELNSPIFGPILRRVAPSDTYTLTKIGTRVRIDGELRGIEDVEKQISEETMNGVESHGNHSINNNNNSNSDKNDEGERGNEERYSLDSNGGDDSQISISLSDIATAKEDEKEKSKTKKKKRDKKKKRGGGLLPVWNRAPFSIVFLANPPKEEENGESGKVETAMLYFDHENKKCIDAFEKENSSMKSSSSNSSSLPQSDLFKDISAMTPEEQIETEVDLLFVENPSRGVYEPQEYTFAPVDSWGSYLGVSERKKESKIDGRYAKVMEAKGKAMETRKYRAGFLPEDETYDFESYASDAKEFQDRPIYRDVTRIRSVGKKRSDNDFEFEDKRREKSNRRKERKNGGGNDESSLEDIDDGTMGRKMSCRVWLVENFPLKVQDLLPVVEVASQANKNMKRFRNLLINWGNEPNRQNFFPVKCSIPIAYTVHLDVLLHNFKLLEKDESDRLQFQDKIFNTPDGYDLKGLDEAIKELEDKLDKLEATAMAEEERERALMREEEEEEEESDDDDDDDNDDND